MKITAQKELRAPVNSFKTLHGLRLSWVSVAFGLAIGLVATRPLEIQAYPKPEALSSPSMMAQRSNVFSANDKYYNSAQILNCPNDRSQYGDFYDYGYWGGGSWCGQTGSPGFWVWVNPNWYVWQERVPATASANGQYSSLVQVLNCPRDRSEYGDYHNYGYWGGGSWCGQTGAPGYWTWVNPNWYVWKNTR